MTRSIACPPSWRPQLPPVIVTGAGALQAPDSVRQVAIPLPWFPPNPTAIFTIDGITAMHLALFITLSGIALSFTAMISSNTFADALSRLSISDWFFSSSADHPEPTNREQMPSTSRHLTHAEGSRVMFFLFCALVSTLSTGH